MDVFIDNSFVILDDERMKTIRTESGLSDSVVKVDTQSENFSNGSSDNYNPELDKNEFSSSMSDDERIYTEVKRVSKVI